MKIFSKMWLIALLLVVFMAGPTVNAYGLDTTPPIVSSTNPADGATGVAIGRKINVTFSEAMDPRTVRHNRTFILMQGITLVGGNTSTAGNVATFLASKNLAPDTEYTVTITTGVKDLAGNPLASEFVFSFTTGATPDDAPPKVSFTSPIVAAATCTEVSKTITATFSEAMNPRTINRKTFTLMEGTTPVSGDVTYVGTTAVFTPLGDLEPITKYTATITTKARDLARKALASDFVWSFTTCATADTTAPTVISTNPADGDVCVPLNKTIAATFSEAMDPLTTTTANFLVTGPGATTVTGTVAYVGNIATFTPLSDLADTTAFTATVTTGVTDLAGNPLASDFDWGFTTCAPGDITAPTVISTNPADAATGVAINKTFNATFSEAMNCSTITTGTFTVTGPGGAPVTGTVTCDACNDIVTFKPLSDLAANTAFTATLTTGVTDLAGNALASNFDWSFTTGTTTDQTPVALGTASTFAVLAGTTVTNTGATPVDGDVGVSPGAAVTGFPPGTVNGTIHAADFAADEAQTDLTTAYNDAAGRTPASAVATELGGQTLTPGVYNSAAGTFELTGTLTLDAQGDPNAVFIFQMASTLITASASTVELINGANPCNVFWQVGSSATLGTNSDFKGNILAQASITLTTGASLDGRALARTGAVTLDTNTIRPCTAGSCP